MESDRQLLSDWRSFHMLSLIQQLDDVGVVPHRSEIAQS